MIESGRISSRQAAIIVYITVIGSTFLFLPRILLDLTRSDGLIAMIGALIIASLLVLVPLKLMIMFPTKNIFEIELKVLGKYLGSVIVLFHSIGFMVYAAILIRSLGEFFITMIMPETPLSVFIIAILILTTMASALGIEAIGRMGEFWLAIIVISLIFMLTMAFGEVELSRLRPLFLPNDFYDIVFSSIILTGVFLTMAVLQVFFPYINDQDKVIKKSFIALILGWITLVSIHIVVLAVFGKDLTRHFVWPTLALARNITIGDFLERMEAVFVVVWILLAFLKISIFVYGATLGICQRFTFLKLSWVSYPLALPIYFLVFQPRNMPEVLFFTELLDLYLVGFSAVGLPALLILVAKIRGMGGKGDGSENSSSNSNN